MTGSATELAPATIHRLLAERWSPRSYDTAHELSADVTARILEAARWAPSASNSQPWRFLVANRGTPEHTALLGTLVEFNQVWAQNASALILIATLNSTDDGKPLRWSTYDAGQAAAHLSVQAHEEGLWTHQMAGFDPDKVRSAFALPAEITPLVVLAIGDRAHADLLPQHLAEREVAPRVRRPIDELLISTKTVQGGPAAG
jgi:nitroreductase